jgi:glycosyltransferase involved in cell wall biosynthesis
MISAVVLAKEGEDIEDCLKALEFCEEIIIVKDTKIKIQNPNFPPTLSATEGQSKFQIKSKIQISKLRIFNRPLWGDFAGQRNFGMGKAKYDWVLFVDSDEIVSKELKKEIILITKSQNSNVKTQNHNSNLKTSKLLTTGINDFQLFSTISNHFQPSAYYIKRRDWWWGRQLKWGETRTARSKGIIRLVRKGSGKWEGRVHEKFVPVSSGLLHPPFAKGGFAMTRFESYLEHYPHQTISSFLQSINFYSSIRAEELLNSNKKTNIIEIILYPFGKFIYTYFIKLGFLDEVPGFVYSFMMSFYSFLWRGKVY